MSKQIRQNYWDTCRAEGQRVMDRFGIAPPRCGFGIGLGWIASVERAFEKMVAAGWNKDLHQVKQKFCGLRIYIGFGGQDDVDNFLKKIVRKAVHKLACQQLFHKKIRHLLFDLRDSNLLRQWRPNRIAKAVAEAEEECWNICEVCGKEREKKGQRSGWALCNACDQDNGKTF